MDNRHNERHEVLKSGRISFQGSDIDCTVHNISIGGANIEVDSQVGIPDAFYLAIDPENGKQYCHVAWRKGRRIGVAFDGGHPVVAGDRIERHPST